MTANDQRINPPPPLGDRLFRGLCGTSAASVLVLAAALALALTVEAWPFLRSVGIQALMAVGWNPSQQVYGVWALVYGTLATSLIALALAVPLGVGSALFLSEIAGRRLRRIGSFLIELLAAIPSVVYGFWGLLFLAPLVRFGLAGCGIPYSSGQGILAAGLILAIMVIPYITAVSFEVCRAVSRSQREAALALGATRWQMIATIVLPHARPGIIAACFLALGRALGETMAVTLLIGNNALEIRTDPAAVGDSLASVIANQLNEAGDELHRSGLVSLGLLLFVVTLCANLLAKWFIAQMGQPRKPRSVRHTSIVSVPAESPRLAVSLWQRRWAAGIDRCMTGLLGSALVLTLVPLFLILGYIAYRGVLALNLDFFTHLPAPPGQPGGGLAHALGGSVLLVGLATLVAVPCGILAAVYLAEYRRSHLTGPVRFVGELLGGVPSIVIGIFAYVMLVGPMRTFSAWAGAFALAVMMIPIVMRSAEESLRLVPASLREASFALGASHWQTVVYLLLPTAWPAIITGVFLAIGRIAGETAPLLLTAYGSNFWPRSPNDRTPFLPKYIYDYARSGYPDWERQAWAAALLLVVVVMLLNVGTRWMTSRTHRSIRAD